MNEYETLAEDIKQVWESDIARTVLTASLDRGEYDRVAEVLVDTLRSCGFIVSPHIFFEKARRMSLDTTRSRHIRQEDTASGAPRGK